MSKNDAIGFVKAVMGDETLLSQLQSADEDTAIRSAKERGFEVAPGEIAEVLAAATQEGATELSETQLDAIAGGAIGKMKPFLGYTATDDLWEWRKSASE